MTSMAAASAGNKAGINIKSQEKKKIKHLYKEKNATGKAREENNNFSYFQVVVSSR